LKRAIVIVIVLAILVASGFGLYRWNVESEELGESSGVPTTTVKRGDVVFAVTAQGDLQGGSSKTLTAPMTGGNDMVITFLKDSGELVQEGEVVAEFDTTEQEYELAEAEANMAEAEQQLIQARALAAAREEESRYALLEAETRLKLAELEARKNPLLAAIAARQNELEVEAARDRLGQLQQDFENRKATSEASIATQQATMAQAEAGAARARTNIAAMTLRASREGYVSVAANMNTNVLMTGMVFPELRVGDATRAGLAVAEIPDLESWEVRAQISELDRGHVEVGQDVDIAVIAVPDRKFHGRIQLIGGTTGYPWDRRFECRISLNNPSPELRQGMTVRVVVTTGTIKDSLWIPSQALFESDSRAYVYLRTDSGFVPHNVELIRKGESQAVVRGVEAGDIVALASPADVPTETEANGGALEAIPTT